MMDSAVLTELSAAVDGRLVTEVSVRKEHAHDISHHDHCLPEAVAYPVSSEEVSRLLQICTHHRIPVVPFGTGTAVEGGVIAVSGGLCIDLGRMNRILDVRPVDRDARVEAGVTRMQLNRHLGEINRDGDGPGLFFSVDPGADASLGGMAATCASGGATVRYGTMRDNVLGLTVVLSDGTIVRTGGRARKSSAGYNLTGLLVGSEGTLGVITELTLRLQRRPEAVSAAVCPFPDDEAAIGAALDVLSAGIPVARLEYLDRTMIDTVNRYSGLSNAVTPTLFFEFHGTALEVEHQAEAAGVIARRHGATEFQWAVGATERDRLWQARYDAYYACIALRDDSTAYVTDVCVPIANLSECLRRARTHLVDAPFPAPVFGHVGDGNFHVVMVLKQGDVDELQTARKYGRQIVDDALDLEGTCTGEHGIGLGKRDALVREHGTGVDMMRRIKQALDPLGLMNPGKVLPAE